RELAERYEVALGQPFRPPTPTVPLPGSHNGTSRRPTETTAAVADLPMSVPALPVFDPNSVVHYLEAWMPETIAAYKLRGFVNDVGGEVVESVPGKIRVRLGGRGSPYWIRGNGPLAWLGLGRKPALIDMELHLERNNPTQQSLLTIMVLMRSPVNGAGNNPAWRERCNQVFCDLRAYLMGQAGATTDTVR